MKTEGELSADAFDWKLATLEANLVKHKSLVGRKVKQQQVELDFLIMFEEIQKFIMTLLKETGSRDKLQNIFGGDCGRIVRLRVVLETVQFSDQNVNDKRRDDCLKACESVEQVLKDLGCSDSLRGALAKETMALQRRQSTLMEQFETATKARTGASAEPTKELKSAMSETQPQAPKPPAEPKPMITSEPEVTKACPPATKVPAEEGAVKDEDGQQVRPKKRYSLKDWYNDEAIDKQEDNYIGKIRALVTLDDEID